jgi:hypothetical protein
MERFGRRGAGASEEREPRRAAKLEDDDIDKDSEKGRSVKKKERRMKGF